MSAKPKEPESKGLALITPEFLFTPDIIIGEFVPANINLDVDKMIVQAGAWVEDKRALVTPETIKGGKDTKAEFNKQIKALDDLVKKIDKIVDGEWTGQKARIKAEVKPIIVDGMEVYKADIAKIENEVKELVHAALVIERDSLWELHEVDKEYRHAPVDDLLTVNGLTSKGELIKGLKTAVHDRVQADLGLQNKIIGRILAVENLSLRNDINPPLSRANVESFLYADDFGERLEALIAAEVQRKNEAEERLRKKLEAEKQKAIDDALAAQQAEANRIAREAAAEEQRIAAQAKAEAEAIAQKAKQEAAQASNPAKEVEKLKEEINSLSEINARFPESGTTAAIKAKREELKNIQAAPADAVVYKIQVEYKAKHVFEFTSRPNADQAKMKAYFWAKALKDLSINDSDILSVEVL